MMPQYVSLMTPVGIIYLTAGDRGLTSLSWNRAEIDNHELPNSHLLMGQEEVRAYFCGRLQIFTVKVDLSIFQGFAAQVVAALCSVPYGETITYAELACRAGNPHAARAVGRVMARNPLPIIVPCHRVIATNGSMTGYSGGGGIATKVFLLNHEKTV